MSRFTVAKYVVTHFGNGRPKPWNYPCQITLWENGVEAARAYLKFVGKKQKKRHHQCDATGISTAFFEHKQLDEVLHTLRHATTVEFFCNGSGPGAEAGIEAKF